MRVNFDVTAKQQAFMDASADEVLFGGAAGGGKSHGQLVDAFAYAMRYAQSKQLILRRTFPELEKSLIRAALGLYPREVWKYNDSKKTGRLPNGSVVDFGYCDNEKDVYKYQGAEYDVIRYDELTHFSQEMYLYLLSRVRGANPYPKQVKSSTNPGGVGHAWVKARFIEPAPAGETFIAENGSRVFIPSKVHENPFLMHSDPAYVKRLKNLPGAQQKALLYGDWDLFEGQYFDEFRQDIHVCKPFEIPAHWQVYQTIDYGLDMLACLWVAVDERRRAWVIRELYQPNLIISEAAKRIKACAEGLNIYVSLAPPDLWNRRQESGVSAAEIFAEQGLYLVKTGRERVNGWLAVKEWLRPYRGEAGKMRANLCIFEGCRNLIRTLPALQYDAHRPSDAASQPHEITHAPDALRGFCVWWAQQSQPPRPPAWDESASYDEQVDEFLDV